MSQPALLLHEELTAWLQNSESSVSQRIGVLWGVKDGDASIALLAQACGSDSSSLSRAFELSSSFPAGIEYIGVYAPVIDTDTIVLARQACMRSGSDGAVLVATAGGRLAAKTLSGDMARPAPCDVRPAPAPGPRLIVARLSLSQLQRAARVSDMQAAAHQFAASTTAGDRAAALARVADCLASALEDAAASVDPAPTPVAGHSVHTASIITRLPGAPPTAQAAAAFAAGTWSGLAQSATRVVVSGATLVPGGHLTVGAYVPASAPSTRIASLLAADLRAVLRRSAAALTVAPVGVGALQLGDRAAAWWSPDPRHAALSPHARPLALLPLCSPGRTPADAVAALGASVDGTDSTMTTWCGDMAAGVACVAQSPLAVEALAAAAALRVDLGSGSGGSGGSVGGVSEAETDVPARPSSAEPEAEADWAAMFSVEGDGEEEEGKGAEVDDGAVADAADDTLPAGTERDRVTAEPAATPVVAASDFPEPGSGDASSTAAATAAGVARRASTATGASSEGERSPVAAPASAASAPATAKPSAGAASLQAVVMGAAVVLLVLLWVLFGR